MSSTKNGMRNVIVFNKSGSDILVREISMIVHSNQSAIIPELLARRYISKFKIISYAPEPELVVEVIDTPFYLESEINGKKTSKPAKIK